MTSIALICACKSSNVFNGHYLGTVMCLQMITLNVIVSQYCKSDYGGGRGLQCGQELII